MFSYSDQVQFGGGLALWQSIGLDQWSYSM